MQESDFEAIEARLAEEIAQRTKLGGYSPDAGTILYLCEVVLALTQYVHRLEQGSAELLKEERPRPPKVRKRVGKVVWDDKS